MEHINKSQTETALSGNDRTPPTSDFMMGTQDVTMGVTTMMAPGPITTSSTVMISPYTGAPKTGSLLEVMARPIVIADGSFTSGSNAFVAAFNVQPNNLTSHLINSTGALGFRCTTCYRLEITAAPQACGIVRIAGEHLPAHSATSKVDFRPISVQLPGAEINLSTGSSCEFRMPFIYDRDFIYRINSGYSGFWEMHRVKVWPLSPVSWDTTTVSTPSYVVYRWLEDVELFGAATGLAVIVPQAGESEHGVVSKWFRAASSVFTYAAKIPLLSSYVAPLGWVTDAAAKVAAHYGWSKPYDGAYSAIMGSSYSRGHNTCADADYLQPMGFYANNKVQCLPGFAGSEIDEMSLCHLTCKPGLIASFNLLPGDVRGGTKWTCPVNPGAFFYQSSSTGLTSLTAPGVGSDTVSGQKAGMLPSPILFVASFFDKWRGDLVFRFKFAATKFHAGRYIVGYIPGEDVAHGTTKGGLQYGPVYTNRMDYLSTIVDLRTTTEVEFEVPFTYGSTWARCGLTSSKTSNYSGPNTGIVFVQTLDALYGPDNVPQTVGVLVEVFSKCGLEFSQPITSQLCVLDTDSSPVIVAQSGQEVDDDHATKYAAGERILSLKQIAMRPLWEYFGQTISRDERVRADPMHFAGPTFVASSYPYLSPTENISIVGKISSLFALWRGSVTFRMLPSNTVSGRAADFRSTTLWHNSDQRDFRHAALSVESRMANSMQLPYYADNARTRTGWSARTQFDQYAFNRKLINNAGGTDSSCVTGCSAGDDYQLGCFTGVPPCVFLDFDVYSDNYFSEGSIPS